MSRTKHGTEGAARTSMNVDNAKMRALHLPGTDFKVSPRDGAVQYFTSEELEINSPVSAQVMP